MMDIIRYHRPRLLPTSAWLVALMFCTSARMHAQSQLSIVDVLSPFDLTATLLSNGHFSVTTRYTGAPKTLIYQEDGSGGRPVNYTSHVHFKVDDVIFQLPFELNPTTRMSPPDHPLTVTQIYRDTVASVPRVNASAFGLMPDGDTIRFKLWMEPVKRPSGGFIRISTEVFNSSGKPHNVGVLMLVDTKIGDNDRAPIISAFGYQTVETEFEKSMPPGMPPFWLGLEGTPTAPGLTARGNVVADGLITPDYFLFGNWKDNPVVGATGLDLAQWNERRAVNSGYTDSAVLLLWLQEMMNPGERRTRASTEIGLVDSLGVSFGSGGWGGIGLGGGGIGGGGGGGGCLRFDTVAQRDCGDATFHPYTPDSLQALFLLTNTTSPRLDGAEIHVESLPPGLTVGSPVSPLNPQTLTAGVTGVSTLTFFAKRRLYDTAYHVPITVRANGGEVILSETLCIVVPGLPAKLKLTATDFGPLCPGLSDTLDVPLALEGPLCLDLLPSDELLGAPADVAQFSIVTPQPAIVPSNGTVGIPLSYTASASATTHRVRLVLHASVTGLNHFDRDSTVVVSDTLDITGISRDAEFDFAGPGDTLDFGNICVGDTAVREWTITNIGGCDLTIDDTYRFVGDPLNQFSVSNGGDFPMMIPRKLDGTALVKFSPTQAGTVIGRFIVTSSSLPFQDTLIVKGVGDAPRFTAVTDTTVDTICPNRTYRIAVRMNNPTACAVAVDSVFADDSGFVVDAPGGFILPPGSGRTAFVSVNFPVPGVYATNLNLRSASAGDTAVAMNLVVASRELAYPSSLDIGDVRVGTASVPTPVTIASTGSAGVEITNLRLAGIDASEYTISLPGGETLPVWLAPGAQLVANVVLRPGDIEFRRSSLVIETSAATSCGQYDPVSITGRGVLPIIDLPRRRYDLAEICAGSGLDTAIVLRNFGNAPLTISGFETLGNTASTDVTVAGLPVTIQPDSTALIGVRAKPTLLGPFAFDLHFLSDGEPFSPGDTIVRVDGAGIICGSISIDTVRATVGDVVDIPIRLNASPLTDADVGRLMNASSARSISMSIDYDPGLVHFLPEAPASGMMSAYSSPPLPTSAAGHTLLASNNNDGDIGIGSTLATLRADVLLGRNDRSTLTLRVNDFAGGWSRITTHDGLVLASYCSIDRRYVELAKPFIRPASTPLSTGGTIQCWLPAPEQARVEVVDVNGRMVASLYNGMAPSGLLQLPLPSPMAAGVYVATLSVAGHVVSTKVVVQ